VPTEVGCGGVRKQIELALSPKERMGLQNSGRVLRETIDAVESRLAAGPVQGSTPAPVTPQLQTMPAVGASNARSIPRGAWAGKK
jgi:hypothetical protein